MLISTYIAVMTARLYYTATALGLLLLCGLLITCLPIYVSTVVNWLLFNSRSRTIKRSNKYYTSRYPLNSAEYLKRIDMIDIAH
jgi:hypothetical protein